jgi:hypothetical protein
MSTHGEWWRRLLREKKKKAPTTPHDRDLKFVISEEVTEACQDSELKLEHQTVLVAALSLSGAIAKRQHQRLGPNLSWAAQSFFHQAANNLLK